MSQHCPRHLVCHPDKPHHKLREAEIPLISLPSGNINGFYFNPVCDFHISQAPEEGRGKRRGRKTPLFPERVYVGSSRPAEGCWPAEPAGPPPSSLLPLARPAPVSRPARISTGGDGISEQKYEQIPEKSTPARAQEARQLGRGMLSPEGAGEAGP